MTFRGKKKIKREGTKPTFENVKICSYLPKSPLSMWSSISIHIISKV